MSVGLALHRVPAEVGEEPEPSWAVRLPHLNSKFAGLLHQGRSPQFFLRHVYTRNHHQHHGDPGELVVYNDEIFVFIAEIRRRSFRYDLAEHAIHLSSLSGREELLAGREWLAWGTGTTAIRSIGTGAVTAGAFWPIVGCSNWLDGDQATIAQPGCDRGRQVVQFLIARGDDHRQP